MKLITKEDFNRAKKNSPYWSDRWLYLSDVVEFLKTIDFKTSLELGSKDLKLIDTSDTMDNEHYNDLTYLHDATKPFPVKDKQYDLFIALQVFEHFGDSQQKAFKECLRVSSKILLSFPYLWHCPKDQSHHNITHEIIKEWTCHVKPVKTWIKNARAFYYFEA